MFTLAGDNLFLIYRYLEKYDWGMFESYKYPENPGLNRVLNPKLPYFLSQMFFSLNVFIR